MARSPYTKPSLKIIRRPHIYLSNEDIRKYVKQHEIAGVTER